MKTFYFGVATLCAAAILCFMPMSTAQAQEVRGMTESFQTSTDLKVAGQALQVDAQSWQLNGQASSRNGGSQIEPAAMTAPVMDDWNLRDSIVFDTWIKPGTTLGVQFNSGTGHIERVQSMRPLIFDAKTAVQKSPRWIRTALEYTFVQLSTPNQQKYAKIINQTVDPYIDEVAFVIAHSSKAFLESPYAFEKLFQHNASLLYSYDEYLPYVEIVDYGTSSTDEDFYSTVRYWKIDTDSNRVQIEVPRDIYYWYVVHPKITDEISTYVDPTRSGSVTGIAAPPTGVFWREFLFTVTEPDPDTTINYPVLKELVQGCDVLWAEKGDEPQAVRQITKWIKSVLKFTSGAERPHQPNRIYNLHMGRCGEHEDLTSAAARACLIPCRGISAFSHDHVWNEFWDEEWWQWEPVNNSHKNPLVYSEGWSWKFGSVMARRSDGVFIPVTDIYQIKTSKLTIRTLDAQNNPIDGAVIMIAVRDDQNILRDTYGCTNVDGIAEFIVGAEREYYARFDSKHGSVPATANQVSRLISNAEAGRTYSFDMRSTATKPLFDITEVTPPADDTDDFRLEASFDVVGQVTQWYMPFDDINSVAKNEFFVADGPGRISLMTTDVSNYPAGAGGSSFDAMHLLRDADQGSCVFNIPAGQDWYMFFLNERNTSNLIHVQGNFNLYTSPAVGVETVDASLPAHIELLGCAPHPVSSSAGSIVRFSVPEGNQQQIRLEVYDLLGRLRGELFSGNVGSGTHSVVLDPALLEAGHYLLRLVSGSGFTDQEVLIVH